MLFLARDKDCSFEKKNLKNLEGSTRGSSKRRVAFRRGK